MWPTHYLPNQPRLDGTPPPRHYLTSPPYPYCATEELASGPTVFLGGSRGLGAEDALEGAAAFVSGALVVRLVSADAGHEDLESAASFVSGALVVRLVVADAGHEDIESAASFVSGALADPLVVYSNWPLDADLEDLLSGAAFVSGVLT